MLLQYGSDELDDPMTALSNLQQTGTVYEYHKAFIRLAHLVDQTERNLLSFVVWLERRSEGKVKMDKPMTVVVAYRSACAREPIALTNKKQAKFQTYKSSSSLAVYSSNAKNATTCTWEE